MTEYPPAARFRDTVLRTWLSVGLIFAILMGLQGGLWLPTGDPARDSAAKPRADFMIFYGAAMVMLHSPGDLYDQREEGAAQKAATGLDISADDRDFMPYATPAIAALLFIPFTLLSYRTAYFIMILINFVLLGISFWRLSSRLKLDAPENKILVLSATAFLPVYGVLALGQITFFLLLLYSLIITDLRDGRMGRAGLWAGLTALKPTLLPVFLLWFAARRYWRTLGWASLVAGAMALFSILLVGINGSAEYVTLTRKLAQGQIATAPLSSMYNLNAIVHFLNGGTVAWLAATGAVLAFLLLGKRTAPSSDWDYCALLSGSALAAPYLLITELNVMLIVVALVLARFKGRLSTAGRWLLLLVMLAPTGYFGFTGKAGPDHSPVVAFALLMFFGIFVFLSHREARGQWSLGEGFS